MNVLKFGERLYSSELLTSDSKKEKKPFGVRGQKTQNYELMITPKTTQIRKRLS